MSKDYNLFVGMGKKEHDKMKEDLKNDMKKFNEDLKQKEKEQKLEEKRKQEQAKIDEKRRAQEEKEADKKKKAEEKGQVKGIDKKDKDKEKGFFGVQYGSFGCSAEEVAFVKGCVAWLEAPGKGRLDEKGVYRLSGSHSAVQKLRQAFNSSSNVNFDEHHVEVHDVTGVLKLYMREMPEPIIPFHMYDSFITAAQINDDSKVPTLRHLLFLLPTPNRTIISALISHLNQVSLRSQVNSMDAKNLAIVFAPNFFRPKEDDPEIVLADAAYVTELTYQMISNPISYFGAEQAQKASASSSTPSSPLPQPSATSVASSPATPSTAPQQQQQPSEYDIMAQRFDPFVLANYITYYESKGYDKETAKQWAVYYLYQEAQQQQAQGQQSVDQPVASPYPQSQPPLNSSGGSSNGGSRRGTIEDAAPTSPRPAGVASPNASRPMPQSPAKPKATHSPESSTGGLPSSATSPRGDRPLPTAGAARPVPLPRPGGAPQSQVASTSILSPRAPAGARIGQRGNAGEAPAPALAQVQERMTQVQRARGESISAMRVKMSQGIQTDIEYKAKMQQMLDNYREGSGSYTDLQSLAGQK